MKYLIQLFLMGVILMAVTEGPEKASANLKDIKEGIVAVEEILTEESAPTPPEVTIFDGTGDYEVMNEILTPDIIRFSQIVNMNNAIYE